jgi:hypothetical protein
MTKRLLGLITGLVMVVVAAVPALAQEEPGPDEPAGTQPEQEVSVTGVVEDFGSSVLPPYGLRDEATGNVYYLALDDVDLGALSGQRITAYGTTEEVVRSVVLIVTRWSRRARQDGHAFVRAHRQQRRALGGCYVLRIHTRRGIRPVHPDELGARSPEIAARPRSQWPDGPSLSARLPTPR